MKKRVFAILLMLALAFSLPVAVRADHLTGADTWSVTFTAAGTIESNFKSKAVQDEIGGLQPGDDITFSIKVNNLYKDPIDWYMLNTILRSLEDSTAAAGGSYSYLLQYRTSKGVVRDLYDSDRVGGELDGKDAPEGLHAVNAALENYFFLESMPTAGSGLITLKVTLDGESQGNSYQSTLADLRIGLAAEVTPTKVVKTGDETDLKPYTIAMYASGAIALLLALDGILQRRKNRRASA